MGEQLVEYDEDRELTRYICDYHADRMTDFEQSVGRAILGGQKAAHATGNLAHHMAVKWGRVDDPAINAALADGPEVFRRRVCARILAEADGGVIVNRCPRCERVVRTPWARQCFWCGFDWHGRE